MRSVLFGLFGALTLGGGALGGAAVAQAPEQAALGAPIHRFIDAFNKRDMAGAAAAYAPAVYSYKQNGVDKQEPSRMTFTLAKGADGWKITSWTWTGPKPTPGPPGKP